MAMATNWFLPAVLGFVLLIVNASCHDSLSEEVVVKPTKLWRFLGKDEEAVQQRFRENIEEYNVGRIKCLRYCIEGKTINDVSHVLHLTWKLKSKREPEMGSAAVADKDITPQIMHEKSIMTDNSQNLSNKCTFSIVTGCEIAATIENKFSDTEKKFIESLKPNLNVLENSSDNTSPTLNFVNEKVVDKSNLVNQTEIEFHVEPNQAEVSAIILGNVSRIDLKIPIGATAEKPEAEPQLTLALSRMRDDNTTALRLNVLNPPPGGWRIGFKGMDVKRVVVMSSVVPEFTSLKTNTFDFFAGNDEKMPGSENESLQMQKKIGISSRQIHVGDETDEPTERSNRPGEISARMISENRPEDQEEQRPFSFPASDNDIYIPERNNISTRLNTDEIEDRVIDRDVIEVDGFTRGLFDELPMKKKLIVELNPNADLFAIANPFSRHRVTFDISNYHSITVRHYIIARSSAFRILSILPNSGFVDIAPGQTVTVAVDVQIPPGISESLVNSITLIVRGIENVEKTVNLYVRALGSRVYDDVRPDVYFYFNNNCNGRTSAEKCLKSYWSVDITVQDLDSGLKSVVSTPRGVYPRSQYVSGTSSPVYFYYSSNCCNRVIDVQATDVAGNIYTRRIDVGVWYNLSEGEIAAIVLGTLLIILLIVLIVISILYCLNRRKSEDFPYSQRYGSRSGPARTEERL